MQCLGYEYSFKIPVKRNESREDHAEEVWYWLQDQLTPLTGFSFRDAADPGKWKDDCGLEIWDKSHQFTMALEDNKVPRLREILREACGRFDQECIYLAGGPRSEAWLVYESHEEATDTLLDWVNAQLSTIEGTRSRPAREREATIVKDLKVRCINEGLLDFALTLPEKPVKTPLDCRIQLMRCRRELQ